MESGGGPRALRSVIYCRRGGRPRKLLILYRSYYGNTREVVETMADRIRSMGHAAAVQDVRRRLPDIRGVDAVLVGAPTRMGRVNGSSRRVMKRLRRRRFSGTVAVFDTCGIIPKTSEEIEKFMKFFKPGAVGLLKKAAQDAGLRLFPEILRCEVSSMKGPLVPDALTKAAAFAGALVYFLGNRAEDARVR
jgi:flavodoxin